MQIRYVHAVLLAALLPLALTGCDEALLAGADAGVDVGRPDRDSGGTDAENTPDGEVADAVADATETGPLPPIAEAGEDITGQAGTPITLDGSASSDPDGVLVAWRWDLGNGVEREGEVVEYTYPAAGEFVVRLTVSDRDGLEDSDELTVRVEQANEGPTAVVVGPREVVQGVEAEWDGRDSRDDDGVVAWTWRTGVPGEEPVDTPVLNYTYEDFGEAELSLTVRDEQGEENTAFHPVTVLAPPVAQIDGPRTAVQREEVVFDGTDSFDPDGGTIRLFEWTWSDGRTTTGPIQRHAFEAAEEHEIRLTVTDDDDLTGETTFKIDVGERPNLAPLAEAADELEATHGDPISFDGSGSSDPDGEIVEYRWDLGNGERIFGERASYTYPETARYTAVLTVTDDGGLTDTAEIDVRVLRRNVPPTAVIDGPETALVGEATTWDGRGSTDDTVIVRHEWSTGEEGAATIRRALLAHRYDEPGEYVLSLTVTDEDGATDTASQPVVVQAAPVAIIDGPTDAIEGDPLTFDGSASFDPDGEIAAWRWDFDDGSTDDGDVVEHAFESAGEYDVTLTVTDDDGNESDAVLRVAVGELPNLAPVADAGEPIEGEVGIPVRLDGTGSTDDHDDIVSYIWRLGNGDTEEGATVDYTYTEAGRYTVRLTVTDGDGLSDEDSVIVSIAAPNEPPVARITGPERVVEGATNLWSGRGSTDDSAITTFRWDLGIDGSAPVEGSLLETAYEAWGTYELSLTVIDDDGESGEATQRVTVLAPPVASFVPPDEPVAGSPAVFDASDSTDPDGGAIASYEWDFGDGESGVGPSPTHVYEGEGSYSVVLTVRDTDGLTDIEARSVVVAPVPNEPPIARAGPDIVGFVGEPVTLNGSESVDEDDDLVAYDWQMGNGDRVSGMVTSYTYDAVGDYVVTLTVTDGGGLTDADTLNAEIRRRNAAPVARIDGPASVVLRETNRWDGSSSSDDLEVVSYTWTTGVESAEPVEGPILEAAYPSWGTFELALTVADEEGLTDTASRTIEVLAPPVAIVDGPPGGEQGEPLAFDGSGSFDPDEGEIVRYEWDFDDGTLGRGADVVHAFDEPGEYDVTLTVTDDDGLEGTSFLKLFVSEASERPPVAEAGPELLEVFVGEAILLDASGSTDPDGDIVSYTWNMGNGDTVTGETTGYTYTSVGTYIVTLTVRDSTGLEDTDVIEVRVARTNEPPVARIEGPSTVVLNSRGTWSAATSSDDTGIDAYSWDTGVDGEAPIVGEILSYRYRAWGTFDLSLTVTDEDGVEDSATRPILVVAPPVASLTGPERGATGASLAFDASASFDQDGGTIVAVDWDWGDGTAASGVELTRSHAYDTAGSFTVAVTVTDDDGLTDVATWEVIVEATENEVPVAIADAEPTTVRTGEEVTFSGSRSRDPDGSIIDYTWDFGALGRKFGALVTMTFAEAGTYSVELTVTDNRGAEASTTIEVVVENRAPTVTIVAPSSGFVDEPVTFRAEAADAEGAIASYEWSYGDGTSDGPGMLHTLAHTYASLGTFTVRVTVEDGDGATASDTHEIEITEAPPDRSGTWSIDGVVRYSCLFDFVSYNFWTFSVDDSYPTLTVNAGGSSAAAIPGDMSGSYSSADSFSVSRLFPGGVGGCDELYTLEGTFTDDSTFVGTFTADYSGSCYDCVSQTHAVTATR